MIDAPMMANFLKYGTEIFGCEDRELQRVTSQCLPALERGELKSEDFWDSVCTAMANAGLTAVPAWRFKGFWEGILEGSLMYHSNLLGCYLLTIESLSHLGRTTLWDLR